MADKQITITATPPLASVATNPLNSVSVPDQQIAVNLPTAQNIVGTVNPLTVAVVLQGLGEENIPDARLVKYLSSEFGFQDGVLLQTVKSLVNGVFADSQTVVLLQKAVQEALTLGEQTRVAIAKPQLDSSTVLDSLQQQVRKTVTELTALLDNVSLLTNKNVQDSSTTTTELSKAIAAVFTEANYFYQDYVSQDYAQLGVNLVDTLTRVVAYTRSFEHLVDATDDFYGLSNIDDDQVAQVLKALVSWAATQDVAEMLSSVVRLSEIATFEQFTATVNKPLLESTTIPDTTSIGVNTGIISVTNTFSQAALTPLKVLASSTNASTDIVFSTPIKGVEDTVQAQNLQETVQLTTSKPLFSNSNVNDLFSSSWQAQRELTSTVGLQDTGITSYQANKVVVDNTVSSSQISFVNNINLAETSYFTSEYVTNDYAQQAIKLNDTLVTVTNYNRDFSSQITLTDDFYGVGNIDDDQTAHVTKNAINNVNAQDQILIAWQANLSALDQTGITEALVLATNSVLNTTTINSDTAQSQLAKVLASPVTNTDVGVVYNQNYFAQSYTALGYAGTITNFS